MIMERKIGEIFEYNGEWHQCVERPEKYDKTVCNLCDFRGIGNCELDRCSGTYRSDKKSVIFKKLEKVGEPFSTQYNGRRLIIQKYKLENKLAILPDSHWITFDGDSQGCIINIEIKQNKEGMEENKLNLKPFNLEAAKSGKLVCTRDGRKARIICFDMKGDICPMVATVEENGVEYLYRYDEKGLNCYKKSNEDLMMLPEKRSGYVNVYKGGLLDTKSYNTKKEAFDKASQRDYIDTVKIEWEE